MPSGYPLDEQTKRLIKEKAPQLLLQNPTYTKGAIARLLGVCRNTLYVLEREDESFKAEMDRAQGIRDTRNVQFVENALLKKLLNGSATGSEYEFYLVNRAPGRWKRRVIFNANQEVNNFNINNPLLKAKESELNDIIAGRTTIQSNLFED
jgi:hypothetical protein